MRLTELDPRWLIVEGGARVGFIFKCPHCQKEWLSVFFIPSPRACGLEPEGSQYALFRTVLPELDLCRVVPCKRNYAWTCSPPVEEASFDSLSVTPSLDASKSGHWHGFITNGDIK